MLNLGVGEAEAEAAAEAAAEAEAEAAAVRASTHITMEPRAISWRREALVATTLKSWGGAAGVLRAGDPREWIAPTPVVEGIDFGHSSGHRHPLLTPLRGSAHLSLYYSLVAVAHS